MSKLRVKPFQSGAFVPMQRGTRGKEQEEGDPRESGECIQSIQLAVYQLRRNAKVGSHKHTSTGEDVHRHSRHVKTEMGLD